VSDPTSHYYTDEQMVAVTTYAQHPVTLGLALSFFPGARPVAAVPAPGVSATALFSSSAQSTVLPPRQHQHHHHKRPATKPLAAGSQALAVAAQGRLDGPDNAKPFRLVVIGDADFASNSFFPYLSNADLILGALAWLRGEERGPAVKPPSETLPTVALTNRQMQGIFILCVLVLPGLMILAGVGVWWRRRY
jgi:ABC-type uncharacterized transport system involved in gliding motility auxiliary subunit